MSLNIQKLNLDISIIRFESDMTPEDFSKELSGVIGKDVWRYTKNKYLNSNAKSEYVFYCGMGTNEQKYSILEDGAILIDNNTKKQLGGFSDLGAEEFKSKIGESFKGYNIMISLLEDSEIDCTNESLQSLHLENVMNNVNKEENNEEA